MCDTLLIGGGPCLVMDNLCNFSKFTSQVHITTLSVMYEDRADCYGVQEISRFL